MTLPSVSRRHVVAVGAGAAEAARLLQHRRPAALITVDDLRGATAALCGLEGAAVVVADLAHVGADDMLDVAGAVARSAPELALGFLYGRGAIALRKAAERLPAAPAVGDARSAIRLLLSSDTGLRLDGAARLEVPHRSAVSSAAVAESELLVLAGHGNPMHLAVGGAVLCRRAQAVAEFGQVRELGVYPCFRGEPCHFGANRGEEEVSIARVASRRVVLLSCFGTTLIEAPFASRWSVGEGFLTGSADAVITCPRAATIGPNDLSLVYFLSAAGALFGALANRLNAARLAFGVAPEFLCFGDPETALASSVQRARARFDGETLTVELGLGDEPIDVVADVALDDLPPDTVFVDETRGHISAFALEPSGRCYLSVPGGWNGQPARFTAVRGATVGEPTAFARQLYADVPFVDAYVPRLAAVNGDSAVLDRLRITYGRLKRLLEEWPLSDLPPAARVAARSVDDLGRELEFLTGDFGKAFVNVYVDLMLRDQRTHPTPWDGLVRTRTIKQRPRRCVYCGQLADEFESEARLGGWRRRWGLCRVGCAYVYDGDPDLGCWLGVPAPRAGAPADIHVPVRNPYGSPVPVRAAAIWKRFANGTSIQSDVASLTLDAGAETQACVALPLPADLLPGTYYVCACSVIGARLNFFRAQVKCGPAM